MKDCQTIAVRDMNLDIGELAARLQTRRGYTDRAIEAGKQNLLALADCRFCAKEVTVQQHRDTLDLGFGPIVSADLAKNLEGCDRAFVFAVTAGLGIDRLLARLSVTSSAELFIADAIGSALAEAACDRAAAILRGTMHCNPRFSPGYGDLPLTVQPALLDFLEARQRLGIYINNSLLMTPTKSITAIMGIRNEE